MNKKNKVLTAAVCGVISGAYERAFIYKDELYCHILNPKTGYPIKSDLISITA